MSLAVALFAQRFADAQVQLLLVRQPVGARNRLFIVQIPDPDVNRARPGLPGGAPPGLSARG